jgi:hyperosmotically inducible protein
MKRQHLILAALATAAAVFSPLTLTQAQAQANPNPPGRTAGEVVDDSVITTKVKAELLRTQATKSLKISVKTLDGVVNLTGSVESSEQMDSALRIVRGIKGVVDVKNNLQLR